MEDSYLVFLEKKFGISTLPNEYRSKFYKAIGDYLNHGRTIDFLDTKIDLLFKFSKSIGLSQEEVVLVLSSFPGILNVVEDLYNKYLFLGIVENEENTIRKDKLINKANDYRVGLRKIYSRYKFMVNIGYDKITWNSLVHATDQEFASIFVVGKYAKPYRIFGSTDEALKALNDIDISDFNVDDYKKIKVNRKIVEGYEGQGFGRRNA